MSHSVISLGLGLGGGKSATSSGRPAGGSPYANLLSASFDGTDDLLNCGDDSSLEPAKVTISAWFKATGSIGNYNYILSKLGAYHGTFHLRYRSNNKFNFFIGLGASGAHVQSDGSSTYTLTDWNHVVLTYDKTNIKLYVNGNEDFSQAETRDILYFDASSPYSGKTLTIGKGPFPDAAEGQIDEVSYFGSALSASNISSMYNNGNGPTDISDLNPISWWRMGDGTGDTNSSGGTPSNGESIGTIKDQIRDNDATQSTASKKPTFSNDVPS